MMFSRLKKRSFYFSLIDRLCLFLTKTVLGAIWKREIYLRGVHLVSFKRTTIIGRPIISMGFGSTIEISKDVILMSSSRFCLSSSLYAPCKIQTIFRSALIKIGSHASLNGTSIICRSSTITIGSRTMIGPNVTITDSPFHPVWPVDMRNAYAGKELDAPVEIGNDVWIASQVIVLPGSKIGSGCVIGAGSIVKGEIPSNCLAAGSPARVVRQLHSLNER